MTLIDIDCPNCGKEELDVQQDEAEIGEKVLVVCQNCGYETEGERRPVVELFNDDTKTSGVSPRWP